MIPKNYNLSGQGNYCLKDALCIVPAFVVQLLCLTMLYKAVRDPEPGYLANSLIVPCHISGHSAVQSSNQASVFQGDDFTEITGYMFQDFLVYGFEKTHIVMLN